MSNKEDDITESINKYAQMCFVAKMTTTEAIENSKYVIEDQYLQSILNSKD